MNMSMQKSEILMIKKSCSLIGQEDFDLQLVTVNFL